MGFYHFSLSGYKNLGTYLFLRVVVVTSTSSCLRVVSQPAASFPQTSTAGTSETYPLLLFLLLLPSSPPNQTSNSAALCFLESLPLTLPSVPYHPSSPFVNPPLHISLIVTYLPREAVQSYTSTEEEGQRDRGQSGTRRKGNSEETQEAALAELLALHRQSRPLASKQSSIAPTYNSPRQVSTLHHTSRNPSVSDHRVRASGASCEFYARPSDIPCRDFPNKRMMDTPRSERTSRRRSEGGSGSNNSRRRTADREDESGSTNGNRPPLPRRGSSAAPPIVTARVNASRGPTTAESTTPTSRIPSEEAQAQIITLESQIERLHLRLLEGRLQESRERARAARRELEAMPSAPLVGRNFTAPPGRMPNNGLRSPNNGPASPRSPVVRLSQNTAGGANGSGHDGEDTRRDNWQRLSDFVRPPSSEQYGRAPLFLPLPATPRETVRPRNTALDAATTTRPSRPLRSRPTAETPPEPPRFEPLIRPSRGLQRLEDSIQDMNPELETPYEAAASRHFFMANASLLAAPREAEMTLTAGTRTPNAIPAEGPSTRLSAVDTALAGQRELPRTWHDRDIDYASPIFTRSNYSWTTLEPGEAFAEDQSEAFARGQAANVAATAAVISPTAASTLPEHPVPDRNPAELIQPETTAHLQLQQFHYDINSLANDASRLSERFRLRRREREPQRHYHHPSTGLDGQKGRPEPLEEADMKLDSECKICFGQIADTVLMPCAHLVICQWCADQIGARTKDRSSRHMPHVLCPMCRTQVVDRIKIYRG